MCTYLSLTTVVTLRLPMYVPHSVHSLDMYARLYNLAALRQQPRNTQRNCTPVTVMTHGKYACMYVRTYVCTLIHAMTRKGSKTEEVGAVFKPKGSSPFEHIETVVKVALLGIHVCMVDATYIHYRNLGIPRQAKLQQCQLSTLTGLIKRSEFISLG